MADRHERDGTFCSEEDACLTGEGRFAAAAAAAAAAVAEAAVWLRFSAIDRHGCFTCVCVCVCVERNACAQNGPREKKCSEQRGTNGIRKFNPLVCEFFAMGEGGGEGGRDAPSNLSAD